MTTTRYMCGPLDPWRSITWCAAFTAICLHSDVPWRSTNDNGDKYYNSYLKEKHQKYKTQKNQDKYLREKTSKESRDAWLNVASTRKSLSTTAKIDNIAFCYGILFFCEYVYSIYGLLCAQGTQRRWKHNQFASLLLFFNQVHNDKRLVEHVSVILAYENKGALSSKHVRCASLTRN